MNTKQQTKLFDYKQIEPKLVKVWFGSAQLYLYLFSWSRYDAQYRSQLLNVLNYVYLVLKSGINNVGILFRSNANLTALPCHDNSNSCFGWMCKIYFGGHPAMCDSLLQFSTR